ncbi:lactoylglutathione lyase [Desulfuromonas versatilis]|uniref:Aldoketomutase n=1 Tax=Desulfuromonas versatilis TaxID=2802975 RepID=A0ABM8I1S1_9BACT|nr:VOC family protein [Desulfuromonas versatilis]BCR06778.1 lactoylglutathione lyase [Desulfuromonas versatilis]
MEYQMIHSCIRVLDLEKSLEFYTRAFGFEVARRLDFPEHQFTLCYLRAQGGNFELELTYNYEQKEPYVMGNGYSHLAVGVRDLEGSHKLHSEMGLHPKPLKGLAGGEARFYFIADPDGYLVEVVRQG